MVGTAHPRMNDNGARSHFKSNSLVHGTFLYWAQERPWLITSRAQPIIHKRDRTFR
ncbi:MAG: hypothetical protein F6K10_43890 [Moorea sp. SIO2B7]|nr:hypothetical protein [Moorena sp. SIO2B7]